MMWAGITLAVVAMLWNMAQNVQEGNQRSAIEKSNAENLSQRAQQTRGLAAAKAARLASVRGRQISQMRTEYGASGVVVGEGSPLEVQIDSVKQAKLEELDLIYQGELDAGEYDFQAQTRKFYAKQAKAAGYRKAIGSLISGAGSAMGAYAGGQPSTASSSGQPSTASSSAIQAA